MILRAKGGGERFCSCEAGYSAVVGRSEVSLITRMEFPGLCWLAGPIQSGLYRHYLVGEGHSCLNRLRIVGYGNPIVELVPGWSWPYRARYSYRDKSQGAQEPHPDSPAGPDTNAIHSVLPPAKECWVRGLPRCPGRWCRRNHPRPARMETECYSAIASQLE